MARKFCGCYFVYDDFTMCILRCFLMGIMPLYIRYLVRVIENLVLDLCFVTVVFIFLIPDIAEYIGLILILATIVGFCAEAYFIGRLAWQSRNNSEVLEQNIATKVRYVAWFKFAACCNSFFIAMIASSYLARFPYTEPRTTLFPPFPWRTTTAITSAASTHTTTISGSSTSMPPYWPTTLQPGPPDHHQMAVTLVALYAVDCVLNCYQLFFMGIARICWPECYKRENEEGVQCCLKLTAV